MNIYNYKSISMFLMALILILSPTSLLAQWTLIAPTNNAETNRNNIQTAIDNLFNQNPPGGTIRLQKGDWPLAKNINGDYCLLLRPRVNIEGSGKGTYLRPVASAVKDPVFAVGSEWLITNQGRKITKMLVGQGDFKKELAYPGKIRFDKFNRNQLLQIKVEFDDGGIVESYVELIKND